jgi:hypothetical protein
MEIELARQAAHRSGVVGHEERGHGAAAEAGRRVRGWKGDISGEGVVEIEVGGPS